MESGMAEDRLFCTQCGAEMGPDDTFCPSCGARADGAINPNRRAPVSEDSKSLDNTRVMILLYGVFAVGLGLLALAGSSMMTDPAMKQAFIDAGINVDLESLAASAAMESAVVIVSGACALISSFLISRKTNYIVALILCIAAAATSLILFPLGIITFVVGLYMAYRIKKAESLFS